MSNERNGEAELRRAEARDKSVAVWGGALVVFGLVAEVVLTFAFAKGQSIIEEWGPVVADALIALGVACEVGFAARARSKTEALKLLSDAKVSEARTSAAQAIERAGRLEKEAAEARERTANLERLTAGRRVTKGQYESLKETLRGAAPALDILIEFQNGDMEAFVYASDLGSGPIKVLAGRRIG